jgi:signal transduction histidine kinase
MMKSDLQKSLNLLKIRFIVGGLLLLGAMVGLSVIWNGSIKRELAQQATMFVRSTLSAGEPRRVLESLNGVRLASFESITEFDQNGERMVTLPASIAPVAYKDRSLWHRIAYAETRTHLFLDDKGKNPMGSLSFVYSRFGLADYAMGSWMFLMFFLGIMLSNAQKKVTNEFQREIEFQNSKSMTDLIQKVRHNIRSPLAVLSAYFSAPKADSLDLKEQGQRAARRIEEILSEMEPGAQRSVRGGSEAKPQRALIEISMLAEQIVEEKKLIASNIEFSLRCCGGPIYATIPAMEFKAMLSNIIDNAIQAIVGRGTIQVFLEGDGHLVSLEVKDSGCGIPKDLIPSITEKNFTYGKDDGSGLGLFYAQKLMDDHQGGLQVESEEGSGTTIRFFFPQAAVPSWHCSEISLEGISLVNVYDDQRLVLDLFRRKFSGVAIEVRYHLIDEREPQPVAVGSQIHLMDFDFGPNKKTGLQIVEAFGIARQTVLVTGHYDDPGIQAACAKIGCRLLPKDRISSVRIVGGATDPQLAEA